MRTKNPARRLRERLRFSLVLLGCMIVLHQFLIQPTLSGMTDDAPAINLAGRQRMLSQKLAKAALAVTAADDPSEQNFRRSEVVETLSVWQQSHDRLREVKPPAWFGGTVSQAIQTRFQEIEPHFRAMVDASEALVETSNPNEEREAIKTILANEPLFLMGMHSLVGLYEQAAQIHVQQLQALGLIIMAAILGAQVMIQFGLLRPELMTVGREWARFEADYERLVESMTDGLVAFDRQGNIEFANTRFCEMIGRNRDELTGQPAMLFVCAKQQREFRQLLDASDQTATPVDFQLFAANGSQVDAIVSPQQMRDVHGSHQGTLLVVTDITARKAIEQRSRDLQVQLAHADRLKSMGAMAAALAHEVNQPLGAISNYAEGCLSRLSDPSTDPTELTPPLQGILRAAHRGAEIVRRSRDFSRKHPHQRAEESANELISEVVAMCSPEASKRGIVLQLNLAEGLPYVRADRIQIQQVVINLIQNAFNAFERVEYLERTITLSSRRSIDDEIEISVADSGPGIPGITLKNLFEPFVTSGKGTGLGLAIVREIIESHEGRIWVENYSHKGAEFRFTLPIKQSISDPAGQLPIRERHYV